MAEPKQRKRVRPADARFLEAVADGIRRYMEGENHERRTYKGIELATLLGIDDGALSKYLSCKMRIGGEFLARALVQGIVIRYNEREISAQDLSPQQVCLMFDAPVEFETATDSVSVMIERKQPHRAHTTIHMKMLG